MHDRFGRCLSWGARSLVLFFFVVDLVVRMTLHREGGERGKKGTVAA